jgi:hypothetical protein
MHFSHARIWVVARPWVGGMNCAPQDTGQNANRRTNKNHNAMSKQHEEPA